MGLSFNLARRYMSARKGAFISLGTVIAILGVMLGTAKLAVVMSVTGGFRSEFRDKVLGVNAHVLVLKYSSSFPEYREVMDTVAQVPGVIGVGPFVINPMMVTHDEHTATGVLVKGIDPQRMTEVLDLPRHMVEGSLEGLRRPGATPPTFRGADPLELFAPSHGAETAVEPGAELRPEALELPSEPTTDVEASNALLQAIRESMEGDRPKEPSAMTDPPPELVLGPEDLSELPADAPVGALEPAGGYRSELPDDDALPDDLLPDSCRSVETSALPGVVIGRALKEALHVQVGDCMQVTSPTIGYTYSLRGGLKPPVAKQFKVIGVFDAGFDQYDSKLIYTDLYEAQTFYDSGDTVTGVEMKVQNIENTEAVVAQIGERLRNGLYKIMDWQELNRGLFTALRVQQILMSLVLALIILVAAFTVLATQIMVVLEKKKEIAALKAMGATDFTLLRAFLYQGLFIGIGGAVSGLALGFALCQWALRKGIHLDPKVYFISELPVQIRPLEFLWIGVFAVCVCLVGTLWPALYAARLRPADAFREQ